MNDHLISRSRFLGALVLDADRKTDLIQVHHALEKAVISPGEVRGVIHCKDCKWYQPGEHFPDTKFCYRLCGNDGKRIGYNYAPEDFCSHGEKMEVTDDEPV